MMGFGLSRSHLHVMEDIMSVASRIREQEAYLPQANFVLTDLRGMETMQIAVGHRWRALN